MFSSLESRQSSLEWEDEDPRKEFSENGVRRGHSIELRVLLGLPEIKPLIKNRRQLVTAVKTKGYAKALRSKN